MKALFFGGAFNPPTKAHIDLPDLVRRKLGYDAVIYMPTKSVYIKDDQGKDFAFSEEERLSMLRSIAQDHPWMIVSDHEISSEKQPRTYDSLCALKQQYEEVKLLFGSDKLPELETGWLHVEEICREFGIVCMRRNNDDTVRIIKENRYLSSLARYITLVDVPAEYQSISSSQVRRIMRQRQELLSSLKDAVPEEITSIVDRKEII